MPKKNVPINYSARDYASIKQSLVQHTKRYYPESFKDFNEAGFGSLMLDTVSYVGDVLSFYLDYQANESFLDTANEFYNVEKLARQMGFKEIEAPTSQGIATFFVLIPASQSGLGPDTTYLPILKKGSLFSTSTNNQFILNEDVFFNSSNNETVVARTNAQTGLPTFYAIKAYGKVISGVFEQAVLQTGEFERFKKLRLPISNLAEVIKVEDQEGNEYFQVDYLTQDVIYKPIINRAGSNQVSSTTAYLRPFTVPRRFVLDKIQASYYLQFGQGQDAGDKNKESIADPSTVALNVYGKNYISGDSFDPTNLIETDKFGVVPVNTKLIVTARTNTSANVNAAAGGLSRVVSAVFEFPNPAALDPAVKNQIKKSIEVTNEEPIVGDVKLRTSKELKTIAGTSYAAQSRAVTKDDYTALIYKMPPEYGRVKRANIVRDQNSFKRNLNLYVISLDEDGYLVNTNAVVKQNIKIWLNKNRMINDTIDILDAKVVNFGIDFTVIADLEANKYDVLNSCKNALVADFSRVRDLGEPLYYNDIFKIIKDVKGVVDVVKVKVYNKYGGLYSNLYYDMDKYQSADGRYLNVPDNVVLELKFPSTDIKGVVL
jgi:hypothetical protein